jgi:hypothetical protein
MKANAMWRLITCAGVVIAPLLISVAFIALGHPDENGRISLTGEATSTPEGYQDLICEIEEQIIGGAYESLGLEAPHDGASGCAPTDIPQLGAIPYYAVDVSSPAAFYGAVNGKGFNEGYGMQCVAGFKEFMFALSGRYIATSTGGASGYAKQQSQIEPLGFTWHAGTAGMQDGDWGIFNNGTYGHVAMYYQGRWFGQNQGAANASAGNAFNLMSLGITPVGYYRPNIYVNSAAVEPSPAPTPTPQTPTAPDEYSVKSGDTLGGISLYMGWWPSAYGLYGDDGYAQRLADYNGILDRGLIYPDQTIKRVK